MAVAPPVDPAYADLFRTYIVRSAQIVLERMTADDFAALAETRDTALHCLPYTLRIEDAQPTALAIILALAEHMERIGRRDDWAHYLIQGIRLARRQENLATKATLLFRLGRIYQWRSKFSAAETLFRHSAAAYAAIPDREGHALALNRLGFLACLRHDYTQAEQLASQAFALLGPGHPERADSLNVLGRSALFQREWKTAGTYFEQALAIRCQQGDAHKMACNLRDLGFVRWRQNRLEDAQSYMKQSIQLFVDLGDRGEEAAVRNNLGAVLFDCGDIQAAEHEYHIAAEFHLAQGDALNLAIVRNNLGTLYTELERWSEAEAMFQVSIQLREPLQDHLYLADTLQNLAQVQVRQGRAEAAKDSLVRALDHLAHVADHAYSQRLRSQINESLRIVDIQEG